jgi:hypothetical protein
MTSPATGKTIHQRARRKSDALTTIWVSIGRSPPSCSKIPTKTGTRKRSMPIRTSVANDSTMIGYIIAPRTRRLIFVSFSIW